MLELDKILSLQPQDKLKAIVDAINKLEMVIIKLKSSKFVKPTEKKDKGIVKGSTEPKPYVLKKDTASQLVYVYKQRSGYAIDDRSWDVDFGRHMKTAKKMLEFFKNDIQKAALCIETLADYFTKKELSWSFEAVERNKADYNRQIKNYGKFVALGYESRKEEQNVEP